MIVFSNYYHKFDKYHNSQLLFQFFLNEIVSQLAWTEK